MKEVNWYMYDELFYTKSDEEVYVEVDKEKVYDKEILVKYVEEYFDEKASKDEWFESIKKLAEANGYSGDTKAYKENPDAYKGHVGDVCEFIRLAITSKTKTPDLYEILRILGKEEVKKRVERFNNFVK